jgi:hypothetical protein
MAGIDVVGFGKAAQKYGGWVVGENPNFGTGRVGGHAPGSYHYADKAVDITAPTNVDVAPAYPGGKPIPWQQRTNELSWRLKQLAKTDPGLTEVLGPGDPGHKTHVHVAIDKLAGLTPQQLQWGFTGRTTDASGKLTDVMPGAQPAAVTQQQTAPSGKDTYIIVPRTQENLGQDFLNMYMNEKRTTSPLISTLNTPELLMSYVNQIASETPNYMS